MVRVVTVGDVPPSPVMDLPVAIMAVSAVVGTPLGFQFAETFHAPLLVSV